MVIKSELYSDMQTLPEMCKDSEQEINNMGFIFTDNLEFTYNP